MMIGIVLLAISPIYLIIHLIAQARANRQAEEAEAEKRREKAEKEAAKRALQMAAAEKRKNEQATREIAAADKRAKAEARKAEAHARKVAQAQELAELAERRLKAEKELAELRSGRPEIISKPAAEPVEEPANADTVEAVEEPDAAPVEPVEVPGITLDQFAGMVQPKPFQGQSVAFTGRLTISGMTRAQAIEKVKQAGGKAYRKGKLYASSTILVVGTIKGDGNTDKLDNADRWRTRKITEREFLTMLGSYAA